MLNRFKLSIINYSTKFFGKPNDIFSDFKKFKQLGRYFLGYFTFKLQNFTLCPLPDHSEKSELKIENPNSPLNLHRNVEKWLVCWL